MILLTSYNLLCQPAKQTANSKNSQSKRYMKKGEKTKAGFMRPKTWFKGKEYKRARKVKVLGLTCSNGSSWAVRCPRPITLFMLKLIFICFISKFDSENIPSRFQDPVKGWIIDGLFLVKLRPFTQTQFAKIVKNKMGPWLASEYPDLEAITILMDGEKVQLQDESWNEY